MKNILPVVFLCWLFTGCASTISPYFDFNRYESKYTQHLYNDSLKIYHNAFGDLAFPKTQKEMKRQLKGKGVDGVLVYGTASIEPYYEYYLLHNTSLSENELAQFPFYMDTLVADQRYTFIAKSLKNEVPEKDFQYIIESFVAGEDYHLQGID